MVAAAPLERFDWWAVSPVRIRSAVEAADQGCPRFTLGILPRAVREIHPSASVGTVDPHDAAETREGLERWHPEKVRRTCRKPHASNCRIPDVAASRFAADCECLH